MTNETQELKELREMKEVLTTSDLQGYVWVLSNRIGISEEELQALTFIRENIPRSAVIFGDVNDGYLISSLAQRRNIIEPDDYVKGYESAKIEDRYAEFYERSSMNKIKVDTSLSLEKLAEIIIKEKEKYEY